MLRYNGFPYNPGFEYGQQYVVNHINGDHHNNSISNLDLLTNWENDRHKQNRREFYEDLALRYMLGLPPEQIFTKY